MTMSSNWDSSESQEEDDELDPRIQVELEVLNSCTDKINKLEIELDEANTTFRILLVDSARRLKLARCKFGNHIDRARPYYEALEIARKAQIECQKAAVKFQRASEIHSAAKETVALAEARFLSKQHEWQFDNAWQEMLNHATIKVTEAEYQKSESGREHQRRATVFNLAEQRVIMLEQRLKRSIEKSRPYFEEKAVCEGQLDAQKRRVEELQTEISKAKSEYASSLRRLEAISEEIHRRRHKSGSVSPSPQGPREPGVGAELEPSIHLEECHPLHLSPVREDGKEEVESKEEAKGDGSVSGGRNGSSHTIWDGDIEREMEKCDLRSLGSLSVATSSITSDNEELDLEPFEEDVEELRQKVRELSVGEGKGENWASELSEAISRLDNAMLRHEYDQELKALAKT